MFLHSPHHITTLLEQQLLQNIQLLHSPHHITTLLEQQLLQNVQLLHEQRDSRCFHIPASPTSHIIPSSRHLPCYPTPAPTSLETYDNYISLLSTPSCPMFLQALNLIANFLIHCSFLLAPLPRIRPTGADVLEGNLIECIQSDPLHHSGHDWIGLAGLCK